MLERYTSIHPELVYKGVHHYRRFCVTSFGLQSFFFGSDKLVVGARRGWKRRIVPGDKALFSPCFGGSHFWVVTSWLVHPVNHLKRWCLKWILRKPCLLATRGIWPAKTNRNPSIFLMRNSPRGFVWLVAEMAMGRERLVETLLYITLVNKHNYGKSPFCSWVNQLFRLGHFR